MLLPAVIRVCGINVCTSCRANAYRCMLTRIRVYHKVCERYVYIKCTPFRNMRVSPGTHHTIIR